MATDEPQVNGEPRKKRAKIVSACGECRRRKTKCNGELPCRSCYKADVPCVYPIISHAEDKRNNISKAALEAIEDRLKGIENMLHAILRSQPFATEQPQPPQPAPPFNQYVSNDNTNHIESSPPSSAVSIPLPRAYRQSSPPPQSSSQPVHPQHKPSSSSSSSTASSNSPFIIVRPSRKVAPNSSSSTSSTSSSSSSSLSSPPMQHQHKHKQQTTAKPTSSPDVRLPSIHDLSVHAVYSTSSPPSVEIKPESTTESVTDLGSPFCYSTYYPRNDCQFKMASSDPSIESRLTSLNDDNDNKNKRKRP
ncbi:hypothetical protein [Absidia glauca]|uniref:Zn(2)-C6 fungal-type domain-containing protein n=1 Tax=Absidia glauca TaxID=4829 RepID=A0A168N5G1_ABSGL|nr:hypothetical protein [Absidia glauca]